MILWLYVLLLHPLSAYHVTCVNLCIRLLSGSYYVQAHHTATHLLQSALKSVVGSETSQAGSLVAFDRLRFDFSFHRPLSEEELVKIESLVNQWIGTATQLESKVMALQDAKNAGAIAMFGEKYGDEVCISFS
jgi:alanyl-tRNA synthetase